MKVDYIVKKKQPLLSLQKLFKLCQYLNYGHAPGQRSLNHESIQITSMLCCEFIVVQA